MKAPGGTKGKQEGSGIEDSLRTVNRPTPIKRSKWRRREARN